MQWTLTKPPSLLDSRTALFCYTSGCVIVALPVLRRVTNIRQHLRPVEPTQILWEYPSLSPTTNTLPPDGAFPVGWAMSNNTLVQIFRDGASFGAVALHFDDPVERLLSGEQRAVVVTESLDENLPPVVHLATGPARFESNAPGITVVSAELDSRYSARFLKIEWLQEALGRFVLCGRFQADLYDCSVLR